VGSEAVFKNPSSVYSETSPINQIIVRNSVSGKLSDPGGLKKRQNLLIEVGIIGSDGKIHMGSVSLTVMTPSSGAIGVDLTANMIHRICAVALDYPKCVDSTPGAGDSATWLGGNPGPWAEIAIMQEL
jgi:hypothetical protein